MLGGATHSIVSECLVLRVTATFSGAISSCRSWKSIESSCRRSASVSSVRSKAAVVHGTGPWTSSSGCRSTAARIASMSARGT